MKRSFFLLSIIVLSLCIFNHCGGGDQAAAKISPQEVTELLQKISKNPFGFTVKAAPDGIIGEPAGKSDKGWVRHLVTLKRPELAFDISALEKFSLPKDLLTGRLHLGCESLTLLYGPKDDYLEIVACQDMRVSYDFTVESKPMNFKVEFASMKQEGVDMSFLLRGGDQDPTTLAAMLFDREMNQKAEVKGLKYEISFTPGRETAVVSVTSEKVEWTQVGNGGPLMAVYLDQKEKKPDFSTFFENGSPIFDIDAVFSNLDVSVLEGELKTGGCSVKKASLHYYLKPGQDNKAFDYGQAWGLEGMTLSIPGKEKFESVGNLESGRLEFVVQHLSPEFLTAYFEVSRENLKMSTATVDKEEEERAQQMMALKLLSQLAVTKPGIKVTITGFKHFFGQMEADGYFRYSPPMAFVGKATVKIFDLDGVVAKLKESKLFPAPHEVSGALSGIFVKDDQGNGVMTFESKADEPGVFYLNGKPLSLGGEKSRI